MKPTITSIDHLVLTVRDIDRTCAFYETVLGMTQTAFTTPSGEIRRALVFGDQKINLHQQGNEFEPKADKPTAGSADLCFLSETPLNDWIKHLANIGQDIEQGPVRRTGATGPISSIYLRDPDRNLIEISNRG